MERTIEVVDWEGTNPTCFNVHYCYNEYERVLYRCVYTVHRNRSPKSVCKEADTIDFSKQARFLFESQK